MKVLLLGFVNMKYMPYMQMYLEAAPEIVFDLLYWDRTGEPDVVVSPQIKNVYRFGLHMEEPMPLRNKLKYFNRFRIYAKKILNAGKYDRIIVLQTVTGIVLLDWLFLHMRKRYILDFRDITYEKNQIYKQIVAKLVVNSYATMISSDGFRKFLPKSNRIYTVHNYQTEALKFFGVHPQRKTDGVIRIGFWGLLRHPEINCKLINALGNDSRFELHYHSPFNHDAIIINKYAEEYAYLNVFFHGGYMPEKRFDFAPVTDIIHNIYDPHNRAMEHAMSNKFYDGVIYHIPQICTQGTFMATAVKKQGIGEAFELDCENLADRIYQYYQEMDWSKFDEKCKQTFAEIAQDQKYAQAKIRGFLLD